MTVRRYPLLRDVKQDHVYTEQFFLRMAELARAGKMRGGAVAGVDEHLRPVLKVAGWLKHNNKDAIYVVSLLKHRLITAEFE